MVAIVGERRRQCQHGDDSFDEIDRVEAGFNGGWVQIMGPVSRIKQWKDIETSPQLFGCNNFVGRPRTSLILQRKRCHACSCCRAPVTSIRYLVGNLPCLRRIGFLRSNKLGQQYEGDLFVGAAAKHDLTESETLLFGRNFGVGTDIKTGPNGNLFVVSVSKGSIFEIFRH